MNDLESHVKDVVKCLEKAVGEAEGQLAEARDDYEECYLQGVQIGISWALHVLKKVIPCPYGIGQEDGAGAGKADKAAGGE
jgi:hypothetical protein